MQQKKVMATLSERRGKKGVYFDLRWSEHGRERKKSLGIISRREAETFRKAKEIELETGRQVLSHAPLFRDLAERYLEWHRSDYPDSHERIRFIVEKRLRPVFSIDPADQINPSKVEVYKADRLEKVSQATVAKEIRTLKAVLNWGVSHRIVPYNCIQAVKPPQIIESRPFRWYTMEELQTIYEDVNAPIWRFMVNTGIRRGEVRAFEDRGASIIVRSTREARTKSRKWREIPLNSAARASLSALTGEIPMHGPNLTRAFRAAHAGLGGSLYSLRHTFATHQAMKGTPVRVLQQLMGHANVTTTEKYLHVASEHLEQAMRGFEL
jgi:integrase